MTIEHIDLMVDEFKRIRALVPSGTEIADLCDRAIRTTLQKVPVIAQRDDALQQLRSSAHAINGALFHIARHTDDDSPAVEHIQTAGRIADSMLGIVSLSVASEPPSERDAP